jgi:probable rRNA maturation factor
MNQPASPTTTDSPLALALDLQIACNNRSVPSHEHFTRWASASLDLAGFAASNRNLPVELCIRVVDTEESQTLNADYRGKDCPTNVLSFAMEVPDSIPELYLGDLVICADVVSEEAQAQHKTLTDHWAHLTVHGILHLLGFDHIEPDQADAMEALETRILASFGIADPYTYPDNENEANQIAS